MDIHFPCLSLIASRKKSFLLLEETVSAAVKAGVDLVQVREPGATSDELRELAASIKAVVEGRVPVLINGPVEIALELGLDGLHLPEAGPKVSDIRKASSDRLLIGRSVHSVGAAVQAEADRVDYIQVGSMYPTSTHPGIKPAGIPLLREICEKVSLPVLAVGGITAEVVPELMNAGADGVAVISGILGSQDPAEATRKFREVLKYTSAIEL